jgi:O-methyltransferase domain/Dimerisation domain
LQGGTLEAHVSRPVETVVNPEQQQQQDTAQHVFQLAMGFIVSSAVQVATELRIADLLAEGPRGVADLARERSVNEDALYRVLRALASVGVFDEIAPRRFALNPAAATLRSDTPGSLYDMVRWISDPFHLRVYADAMHSVTTGDTAVKKAVGVEVFEYFSKNPELSRVFNNAMTSFSAVVVPAALEAYDFSGIRVLVDVAGGHGGVLTGILDQHPAMRGILCDLDHVIAGARQRIGSVGLQDRIDCVTADIFAAVPAGGDAYLMKHIIHDWDDQRAGLILRNIRKVLPKNGRVILLESVLAPGNAPDFGKILDLEMLLLPGGRERTADEFRALFAANGFELTKIVPTKSPLAVVEAVGT